MTRMAMISPQVVPLAAMCGLVLASVAVSVFTLWRARALIAAVRSNLDDTDPPDASAIELLKQEVAALQKQVQDTRQYPPPGAIPAAPRSGLNLDKRSQALRLHRRGEAPKQIAAILELPIQEVELLIKVHRIVLRTIG
jgi:hypothetical protein